MIKTRARPEISVSRALLLLLATLLMAHPGAGQGLLDIVDNLAGKDNSARVDAVATILEQRGLEFEVQAFSHSKGDKTWNGRNLIVSLAGSDSSLPSIVVGAHLDAAPLPDGGLSQGAIDNAAGTSIVIELATRLSAAASLRHDFRFVLFDMEELGFVGSRHYVESLEIEHDRANASSVVSAMVNLDIATSGQTILFGPASAPGNEALYDLAARLCGEQRKSCLEFPQYPPSDEKSFQPAGIPNISFAIIPQVEAHQLWLLLNGGDDSGLAEGFLPATVRSIHSPGDTVDKVSESALETLSQYLETYLHELDDHLDSVPGHVDKDESNE
jgi:Zn-dependent M28 family amino/carboxypeptidase